MNARVFGRQPSPRVLVQGFTEDIAQRLGARFPTVRVVGELQEVRHAEWDLLITSATNVHADAELFVISIGSHRFGSFRSAAIPPMEKAVLDLVSIDATKAREFVIPADVEPEVARLAQEDLLPCIAARTNRYVHFLHRSTGHTKNMSPGVIQPFVETTEPRAIAARFQRREDGPEEWWILPEGADPVRWAEVACRVWSKTAPERFPPLSDWKRDPAWFTTAEAAIASELRELEAERAAVVQDLDSRIALVGKRLEAEHAEADESERRLLASQGDDLVDATEQALTQLGFVIRNMDKELPQNDRREDLRVSDDSWITIVEVRGYKGGAAVNDLLRISGRFVPRYFKDEGAVPNAAWYVVNQFLQESPAARQLVLAGNDIEVQTFGDSEPPGLVIDTVDLFRLVTAVRAGDLDPAVARQQLTSQTGRFTL